jgi:pullulanase
MITSAEIPQLSHPADAFCSSLPLGALYRKEATVFRVFGPTAHGMTLNLYDGAEGPHEHSVELSKNVDGTWETEVKGDLTGRCYTYTAQGRGLGFGKEVIDPYAQCVTAYNGRGLIFHDETPIAPRPKFPNADAMIYELHVRDFSIDPESGILTKGKFLGLAESGTKWTFDNFTTTGLDHIVELGVNTVQILPPSVFQHDQRTDVYGWGYDSIHFNSPDGWYATAFSDATRVREMKQMIDAMHKRGLRVTMDMVYNHTMEDIFHDRVYSFEGLVPHYYYRRRPDGSNYDGSGVGNEFRSEAPMARRFILDSVKHWVNEYKIDGFRFDLMGLMDVATMAEMARELRAIDPDLLIYGEPWAAGTTPLEINGKGRQRGKGWSVFNDDFRDALKGGWDRPDATGFIQTGSRADTVRVGLAGSTASFAQDPVESINYVECHDNHTLWDRLTLSAPQASVAEREAMDKLCATALYTAQGIPFIQAGQELCRTKGGEDNSYNLPDKVNMIRWEWKLAHASVYAYYRGLIALRKCHPMFRLGQKSLVEQALRFDTVGPGVAFTLQDPTGQDPWKRARVLFNPTAAPLTFDLPDGNWELFANGDTAGITSLGAKPAGPIDVPPHCAFVLGEART